MTENTEPSSPSHPAPDPEILEEHNQGYEAVRTAGK